MGRWSMIRERDRLRERLEGHMNGGCDVHVGRISRGWEGSMSRVARSVTLVMSLYVLSVSGIGFDGDDDDSCVKSQTDSRITAVWQMGKALRRKDHVRVN